MQLSYTFTDWRLTPYLNLIYLHRRFDTGTGHATSKTGYPALKGRFGFRWEADVNQTGIFYSDVYANWASKAVTQAENGTISQNDPYIIGNFTIGLQGGETHQYDVSLSVRNVFDTLYTNRRGGDNTYGQQIVLSSGFKW
jgi:hypothetical protein